MTVFFAVAVLMVFVTVVVLLWPLLHAAPPESSDRQAVNLAIAKQRLRELGRECEDGILDKEDYEQAKHELELTLAGDLGGEEGEEESGEAKTMGRWMAGAVLILVPAMSVWLYYSLGSPMFLDSGVTSTHAVTKPAAMADIESLTEKLEQRMRATPDNPEGQRLLIRTYMSQGRFADAVEALDSWGARDSKKPALLVMLAEAMAAQRGGSLVGEPENLLSKALESSPKHPQALWMMGYTQAEKNNKEAAVEYWEKLLPLVLGDAKAHQRLSEIIEEVRQQENVAAEVVPAPAVNGAEGLQVEVTLDAAVAAKVSPDAVVFVYAKSESGPPMPLAVIKLKVSDLPLVVKLDDSTAMIATHKLSLQSRVIVGARVSQSGSPIAQPGDYYAELENVATPSNDLLKLVIKTLK